MPVFSFDVTVSDYDNLKAGIVAKKTGGQFNWHRIVVSADNLDDAHLIATQIAVCSNYVTGCCPRI